MESKGKLRQYFLNPGRRYRYLRITDKTAVNKKRSFKVRNDPYGNAKKFDKLCEAFHSLEMKESSEIICKTLAAILILGEVRFVEIGDSEAEIENADVANKGTKGEYPTPRLHLFTFLCLLFSSVADLLGVDVKKFCWSLTNYCLIRKGAAVRKRHTVEEAIEARDVLANTIYQRLVDWTVNQINYKLLATRTLL